MHDAGVTAEGDWGEAKVIVAGVLMTVGLFLMRSCFSGADGEATRVRHGAPGVSCGGAAELVFQIISERTNAAV